MNIRIATIADAKEVSKLSVQFGYPTSVCDTINNIRGIAKDENQIIFVAELNGVLVGWIQLQKRIMVIASPFVEIVGLIVEEKHRCRNIGRSLVQEGMRWAQDDNIQSLRVRSNASREESHGFYKAIGFREVKMQKVYDWDAE